MNRTLARSGAALLLLALTACGSGSESAAPAPAAATATTTTSATAPAASYPVTVENCGREVTFTKAPERIVSGWITGTELLLELGQADKVVGLYNTSAYGAPGATYAGAYDGLEVLSPTAPSREALLAAAPDLIYADGNYLFDGTQLPTVDQLAEQGTQVLVLSGFCDDGGSATVLDVKEDLAALGPALGVEGAAQRLAAQVDTRLAAVQRLSTPVSVAPISSFEGTVYAYEGVYTDLLERAGATNAYAGTLPSGKYFGEVSVEDLTKKDPQTLLYLLSSGETEAAATAYLRKAFPTVRAVAQGRVVFLPQEDASNLRGVDGVEELAGELRSLG